MKLGCSWGATVAAMVCSGVALAQVPPSSASGGSTGAAGAASAAPPAPTDATAAPAVPPEAISLPDEPATAAVDSDESKAEEAPRPRKKPRAKPRRRFFDEDDERDEDSESRKRDDERQADDHGRRESSEEQARIEQPPTSWHLRGPLFVLSGERLTSVLAWKQTSSTELADSKTLEATVSGTDAYFLGAAGMQNPFAIPRVGFDYVVEGGFSLGGTLGYLVSSSTAEISGTDGDGDGDSTTTDQPTATIFLFAPRVGVFLEATTDVAIWLRGGITRAVSSSELGDVDDGNGGKTTSTMTQGFWDLSLDPQLVLSPAPHVGITLGASLDFGLSGKLERTLGTSTRQADVTASSYGVTAGLVAMF